MNKATKQIGILIASATVAISIYTYNISRNTEIIQVKHAENGNQRGNFTQDNIIKNEISSITSKEINDDLIEISFDNESVFVKTTFLDLKQYHLPFEKGAVYLYDALSKKSLDGDPVAARLLSDLVGLCNETFESEEEQLNALDVLVKERKFLTKIPGFPEIDVSDEMFDTVKNQLESDYELCKGLSSDKRGESVKWSRIAAEGGDFLGIDQLLNHPDVSGLEKVSLLEKQWEEFGYVQGAKGLAAVLSGLSKFSSYSDVEPDPKKAYAFFLASSKIEIAQLNNIDSYKAQQKELDLNVFKDLLTSKLSAQEHIEAEKLALQLIKQNSRCCTFDSRQSFEISSQN